MKHARSLGCTVTSSIAASLPAASASCHEIVGRASMTASGGSTVMQCVSSGVVSSPTTSTALEREVALHHEHLRARIGELMAEELAFVRGVDRHLHRTELQGGEETDDLLGAVLEQRRDPIAG